MSRSGRPTRSGSFDHADDVVPGVPELIGQLARVHLVEQQSHRGGAGEDLLLTTPCRFELVGRPLIGRDTRVDLVPRNRRSTRPPSGPGRRSATSPTDQPDGVGSLSVWTSRRVRITSSTSGPAIRPARRPLAPSRKVTPGCVSRRSRLVDQALHERRHRRVPSGSEGGEPAKNVVRQSNRPRTTHDYNVAICRHWTIARRRATGRRTLRRLPLSQPGKATPGHPQRRRVGRGVSARRRPPGGRMPRGRRADRSTRPARRARDGPGRRAPPAGARSRVGRRSPPAGRRGRRRGSAGRRRSSSGGRGRRAPSRHRSRSRSGSVSPGATRSASVVRTSPSSSMSSTSP